jgi:hypothetical protein
MAVRPPVMTLYEHCALSPALNNRSLQRVSGQKIALVSPVFLYEGLGGALQCKSERSLCFPRIMYQARDKQCKNAALKSSVFCDTSAFSPLKINRHFGGIHILHLQARRISQAINPEVGAEMLLRTLN